MQGKCRLISNRPFDFGQIEKSKIYKDKEMDFFLFFTFFYNFWLVLRCENQSV